MEKKKKKFRNVLDLGLVIALISLLITIVALWHDLQATDDENRAQSTRIALMTLQLGTQEKMATVQAKMATSQASGENNGPSATAIAEELVELKKTQEALTTKSVQLRLTLVASRTPNITVDTFATSTPTLTVPQEPDQFIRYYYDRINARDYDTAWNMLTESFQADKSGTFEKYVNWWNTIDKVELFNVTTLPSNDPNNSKVKAIIRYYRNDGAVVESLTTFTLIPDGHGYWLISQTE